MLGRFGTLENVPRSELGGKAYSLNRLIESHIDVPVGIVIFSSCFIESLKTNNVYNEVTACCQDINSVNILQSSRRLTSLVMQCEIDDSIINEIKKNAEGLEQFVSVRSSAASEDGEYHTFAGLHDSFLNVDRNTETLTDFIKKCWASLFNERALIYRTKKNIPIFEGMAVVIQDMVQAKSSGVLYTRHPIEKKYLLIESAFGIGDSVVDGVIKPDSILVDRNTLEIVSKEVGTKKTKTEFRNGVHTTSENDQGEMFSIGDGAINELTSIGLNIEKIFGTTQDIEWAFDDKLWVIQSRNVDF